MIDPEAAKITLNADFPSITIVGNAASQIVATQQFADQVFEVQNNYTKLFHQYFNKGYPLWDETGAAVFADPSIATKTASGESKCFKHTPGLEIADARVVYVDVDISYGSPMYGNLRVYRQELAPPHAREATYVLEVDSEKVLQIVKDGMQHPKSCADITAGN